MMVELDRWKHTEKARAEEVKNKLLRERKDRDEQLAYERKLKAEAVNQKKAEEAQLVEKVVTEMEQEQVRYEKKKEEVRKSMRKVFEENAEEQIKRSKEKKVKQEQELASMREYNRILDEQEEQRAEELKIRMARQKDLMAKLQDGVDRQKQEAGDNDARRAAQQQEEMDRHYAEAEKMKQSRLKQLRFETQAYLFKQMAEKDSRKDDDKDLQNIQAQILARDTEEYNEIEHEKTTNKKIRNYEHRKELEEQIAIKAQQRVPRMSEQEVKINRQLLNLVHKTLKARDEEEKEMLASVAKE